MNGTQAGTAGDYQAAVIRPACPADLATLSDFFAGLSAQTRYLRFFAPVTPSPALLRILSGNAGTAVDALVAVACDGIVGHAMAADRAAQGVQRSDIGVVVSDLWQGRGVGAALMRTLIARAQARGVTSVTMDVLPGNRRVLAMITSHWPAVRIDHGADSDMVDLRLPPRPPQRPVARPAGRRAAPAIRNRGAGLAVTGRRAAFSPRQAGWGTR